MVEIILLLKYQFWKLLKLFENTTNLLLRLAMAAVSMPGLANVLGHEELDMLISDSLSGVAQALKQDRNLSEQSCGASLPVTAPLIASIAVRKLQTFEGVPFEKSYEEAPLAILFAKFCEAFDKAARTLSCEAFDEAARILITTPFFEACDKAARTLLPIHTRRQYLALKGLYMLALTAKRTQSLAEWHTAWC